MMVREFDANLYQRDAVEYLMRARSTLHPKTDVFGNIPILASMLDVEIALLNLRLRQGRSELVYITPDVHGFPKLSDWATNLAETFTEVEQVKIRRARAIQPVVSQFGQISPSGVVAESGDIKSLLEQEHEFVATMHRLPLGSKGIFSDLKNRYGCFKAEDGLLTTCPETGTQTEFEERDVEILMSFGEWGFKYIDALPGSGRIPATLLVCKSEGKEYIRSLVPYSPLLDRTVIKHEDSMRIVWKFPSATRESPRQLPDQRIAETLKLTEYATPGRLTPDFFRALYMLDTHFVSDEGVDAFLKALPEVNDLTVKASGLFYDLIVAIPIGAKEYQAAIESISAKIFTLLDNIPDEMAKACLSRAVPGALSGIYVEINKIIENDQNPRDSEQASTPSLPWWRRAFKR